MRRKGEERMILDGRIYGIRGRNERWIISHFIVYMQETLKNKDSILNLKREKYSIWH